MRMSIRSLLAALLLVSGINGAVQAQGVVSHVRATAWQASVAGECKNPLECTGHAP